MLKHPISPSKELSCLMGIGLSCQLNREAES